VTAIDIIGQWANGSQQQENVPSKPTRAGYPKRRNNEDFDIRGRPLKRTSSI
jgi:hypothetical protein